MLKLCRWPNGDFSLVGARNKDEMFDLLDEVGDPGAVKTANLKGFAVHFKLGEKAVIESLDSGLPPFELECIDEATLNAIDEMYPDFGAVVDELPSGDKMNEDDERAALEKMQAALDVERDVDEPKPIIESTKAVQ